MLLGEAARAAGERHLRYHLVDVNEAAFPEGGYDLAPVGEGTQLTFYNVLEPATFVGKLIVGFALRSARKGADDFANSIKKTVEAS